MTETIVSMTIEFDGTTLDEADIVMRKMIKACDVEELRKIKSAKISKTISEVEITSELFKEGQKDGR